MLTKIRTAKRVLGLVVMTVVLATPALADSITNIVFTPPSPASFDFGEFLDFTFDYEISQDSRIWARPFFNGSIRPDYSAHGSPLHLAGTGSASGFFTILDVGQGLAPVDQVRFEIFDPNAGSSQFFFVDVDFVWGQAVPAPEPRSLTLLAGGLGLLGLAGFQLRKKATLASSN